MLLKEAVRMNKILVMNEARRKHRLEHEVIVHKRALETFDLYKNDPLFIAGIMLYWAEGRNNPTRKWLLELTNSNPKLLKVYCNFLQKYFNPDRKDVKARLFLYPDLNEVKTKAFWSKTLGISQSQFIKSQFLKSRSRLAKNKLAHGICCVYIHSKDKRITMDTWIESFANMRG